MIKASLAGLFYAHGWDGQVFAPCKTCISDVHVGHIAQGGGAHMSIGLYAAMPWSREF